MVEWPYLVESKLITEKQYSHINSGILSPQSISMYICLYDYDWQKRNNYERAYQN